MVSQAGDAIGNEEKDGSGLILGPSMVERHLYGIVKSGFTPGRYQYSMSELWILIPLAEISESNNETAGVTSPSPGTTVAHSRLSRNSFVDMLHGRNE